MAFKTSNFLKINITHLISQLPSFNQAVRSFVHSRQRLIESIGIIALFFVSRHHLEAILQLILLSAVYVQHKPHRLFQF